MTVNSDDPAYFGGYLLENFAALEQQLGLDARQALALVRNGFRAAFIDRDDKLRFLRRVAAYAEAHPPPLRSAGARS